MGIADSFSGAGFVDVAGFDAALVTEAQLPAPRTEIHFFCSLRINWKACVFYHSINLSANTQLALGAVVVDGAGSLPTPALRAEGAPLALE